MKKIHFTKKQILCGIIVLFLLVGLIIPSVMFSGVNAAGGSVDYDTALSDFDRITQGNNIYEDTSNYIEEHVGAFSAWAWDTILIAFNAHPSFSFAGIATSLYSFSQFNGAFAGLQTTFASVFGSGNANEEIRLADFAELFYNVFRVIGVALVLLYFVVELLDIAQADQLTVESFMKRFVTLAVAIIFMYLGSSVFRLLMVLGDQLLHVVEKADGASRFADPELRKVFAEIVSVGNGFFSYVVSVFVSLGQIMKQIVPCLFYLVAIIIAYFKSFSRFMEVLVRYAFAPIGCAPLAMGGMRSSGIRYIKKFAAVCLEGAVCAASIWASAILMDNLDIGNAVMGRVIIPLTLIGLLTRSGRISEEIVGV